jgi:hypothetical protein
MKRVVICLLLYGTAIRPQSAQSPRSEVPVSSVVLFSSGVGYFEHSGTVRGASSTELRFRTAQLNDVIKSLVLHDLDGGRVSSITYPSQDPVAKTLRSFQVDITANPGLAQLLNQLRGSRVALEAQGERLSGTIIGVESRSKMTVGRGEVESVPVLNLVAGGTIRSIELQSVASITLDDPQLQEELTKALAALVQSRDQDKKPVVINFNGTGDRRVRLGYVVEAPVWKTSYRLLLGDTQAHLQGWGIVENQTESDWSNVMLSLVSGRPISFVMDLYSPRYLTRPTVSPENYATLRPQVYNAAIPRRSLADSAVNRLSEIVVTGVGDESQRARVPFNAPRPAAADFSESVRSEADGTRMGELFQFTVKNVTLPRQKSAMIPIVTDRIEAERVSIYNASVLAANPLNGVRLRNTTGKTLLQGPVTVLDHDKYAGDARIGDLPAGQERLLSYGVDLEMTVLPSAVSEREVVTSARVEKGTLIVERRHEQSQTYVAHNNSDRARVLIIEHPVNEQWEFVDSPVPYESNESVHRFRLEVAAGKGASLPLKERYIYSQSIAIGGSSVGDLLYWSQTGEIPRPVRSALERASHLRGAMDDLERQIAAHTQRIAEISNEQGRLRENMKIAGQGSQYYERLLGKLNEQESEIERLQRERTDLSGQRDTARGDFEQFVSTLTIR